ncbi:MAG: CPBP family intramembrane metalloprotease [Bifidobacteriaceae bacterium]|jgi:membrane protease YdiL (CAAX protease family)|nr:CPBP family intramembrane metalloprotease [Bifidobacteriaceae bacterium]
MSHQPTAELDPVQGTARRRLIAEVCIVLALSLGASAVYSVLELVDRLTDAASLANQTVPLNTSDSPKPWLDLLYQLAANTLRLAPPVLAVYLLAGPSAKSWFAAGCRRIGLTPKPGPDLGWGVVLTLAIGLPGIGVYLAGVHLGLTAHVSTANLGLHWWTVPVLIFAALRNALVEEVIVVGYLATRLGQLGWSTAGWIAASSLLRGTYHLYQGFGQGIGNVAMGLVFAWFYHRTGRVMPLVCAHALIDIVAFVGPSLVSLSWLA